MKHKITTKRSKTYWWSLGLCVLVLVLVWSGVAYLRHATDGIKVDMTPPVSVMGAGPNSSASSKPLPKVDITPLKNLVDPRPASYTERFKKGAASKDPKEKYDAYRLARECKFSQETFNSGKVQGAEMDCGDFLLSQDNPIHSTQMRLKPLKECAEMGGHDCWIDLVQWESAEGVFKSLPNDDETRKYLEEVRQRAVAAGDPPALMYESAKAIGTKDAGTALEMFVAMRKAQATMVPDSGEYDPYKDEATIKRFPEITGAERQRRIEFGLNRIRNLKLTVKELP